MDKSNTIRQLRDKIEDGWHSLRVKLLNASTEHPVTDNKMVTYPGKKNE